MEKITLFIMEVGVMDQILFIAGKPNKQDKEAQRKVGQVFCQKWGNAVE